MVLPQIPTIEDYFQLVQNRPPCPAYITDVLPQEPGEYNVIAGKTGIGKTILGLQLAFCSSTGTPFTITQSGVVVANYPCSKVVVGFLSLEGDDQNMLDRYQKIKVYFPNPGLYLRYEMLTKERPRLLLNKIKEKIEGCNIVIFDGSRFLMSDYCSTKDSSAFILEFMQMLKDKKVVGIVTLQAKKTDARYLMAPGDVFNVKGATDLVDGATTVILLEHTPHSKSKLDVTLYFSKHRMASHELPDIKLKIDPTRCMLV